ncbi:MAG: PAS domain S-box protein [Burkholderiales bacterium]|nr:PAS domain S-box protein [Burkholderiales bacterium]
MSEPVRPAITEPTVELVLDGAVRAALEAIVTVDDRQRIVMINPAAQRMFGCTAEQALGSELSRFIPQRLREVHARHVREFDASDARELPVAKRSAVIGLRADGTEFPLEASISRVDVQSEFGPRRYFTALLRDLSAEQGMKAEIDALKQRMRAVFELAPVAIWITEGDHIVFANRACAALFGAADHAALVGWSIYSLLRPESHAAVRERVIQALASDVPVPMVNERIVRFDGAEREVVIAVASLPDHGRTTLQMVISDITERSRESQELERSRRELRRLSANLVDAREEERRRIARELHDELGQRLTALKMELAALADQTPQPGARERIAAMLEMVDETVASVRRIATDLRPLMLDDLGLNAAIEWLANGWARRMGIAVRLQLGDVDSELGEVAAIALYRMVQEALTNVARHARATEVQIETRREGGDLVLTVQDNGTGFAEPSVYREGTHGLMGMRERAYMLGGQFEIGGASGGGARVTVRLPLAPHDKRGGGEAAQGAAPATTSPRL